MKLSTMSVELNTHMHANTRVHTPSPTLGLFPNVHSHGHLCWFIPSETISAMPPTRESSFFFPGFVDFPSIYHHQTYTLQARG